MNESDWKRKIAARVRDEGGYARRIEDRHAVGIPDLIVAISRLVLLVEVKMIRGKSFGPTPRQYLEGEAILRVFNNGTGVPLVPVLMGITDDKRFVVSRWAKKITVDERLIVDDYLPELIAIGGTYEYR